MIKTYGDCVWDINSKCLETCFYFSDHTYDSGVSRVFECCKDRSESIGLHVHKKQEDKSIGDLLDNINLKLEKRGN